MASYKAGFDAPTRPGEAIRLRRQGGYMSPPSVKLEYRDSGISHASDRTDIRGNVVSDKPQPPNATRPRIPDPSTGVKPISATKSKGPFGFAKATKPPSGAVPELKGKSSRNVLRRKPSSIAQHSAVERISPSRSGSTSPSKWTQMSVENRPSIEAAMKSEEAYNAIFTRRARPAIPACEPVEPHTIIPELDRYRPRPENNAPINRLASGLPHKLSTHDLPPPTPLASGYSGYSGLSSYHRYSGSGYSASPSTRFSESPGPGPYSRDTTPTSMSSQSPGITVPLRSAGTPKLRQGSPAINRPPVTRRRAGSTPNEVEPPIVDLEGLPSLRESTTSSSSNSTMKDGKAKEKKKKKRLSPLPPSPPPRKSSQKSRKPPRGEQESPSKVSQSPAKSIMSTAELASASLRIAIPSMSPPPLRPSRAGAPDLREQLGDSLAVIQHNLATIDLEHDRRQNIAQSATASPLRQPVSRIPSRNPSPAPAQLINRETIPAPSGLGIIPDLRPPQIVPPSRNPTRTPSPSISNRPRFGLFGRRKTEPVAQIAETEKLPRRGPAAGTGHEGYGRYAHRGRSSSASGLGANRDRSLSTARSASRDSVGSTNDPFLLERMSPVIIAGGGEIIENRNSGSDLVPTESSRSLPLSRPSMESKGSSKSGLSHETSRTTLWPSVMPMDSKRTSSAGIHKDRRPSDSSDDGTLQSSLAFRRSVRLHHPHGTLDDPKPLYVGGNVAASMSSLDASILSDESQDIDRGRQQVKKAKKLERRPKSPRKWNFFHRSQPTKPQIETAVAVNLGRATPKAIPHYAMLDSSDEQLDDEAMDMEDILREAEVVDLSNSELDALQFGNYKENLRRIDELRVEVSKESLITESGPPPQLSPPEPIPSTPEPPQTELHLSKETAPIRPSRLPQVGRIPKVVSARPQATSPKSFSRPFARLSTLQPIQTDVQDKQSVALGQSPPKSSSSEPLPINKVDQGDRNFLENSKSETMSPDFLAFSRKDSTTTTISSSSQSFAGTIAVIPEPGAELAEDEIWDEYDDLIETDGTVKVPTSATSSQGVPFQYEHFESNRIKQNKRQTRESTTLVVSPKMASLEIDNSQSQRSGAASSVDSVEMSAGFKEIFLHSSTKSPTTPMSFSEFVAGYGDRNNSIVEASGRTPRRPSQTESHKSNSSSNNSRNSTSGFSDTNSPISQVNLRVGSMTVSKWLTFGNVLFSPARDEVMQLDGSSKRHSILVIDGLGNDDWSFYAAETYPASIFYNLSPTRPLSGSQRVSTSTSFPLTPENHRQIQYTSMLHIFPFPSSTFSVVVFRFPTALSELAYRNVIAESKRVLKPGGYLEMAILDLDMMNMGNRARRAVRGLKVQMQTVDSAISLASASDTVLRIVGKRGFQDIKSCNVGVPVASAVPSKSKNKAASSTSALKPKKQEMSLADMMKDSSPAGDESITKMVAKVGRWWYSRCYEILVLPEGTDSMDRSIFAKKQLLRECEKWNSSFKLVVAYAQKPAAMRRRTASV